MVTITVLYFSLNTFIWDKRELQTIQNSLLEKGNYLIFSVVTLCEINNYQ